MDTNWLSLGGTEVINTARARAYAAGNPNAEVCTVGSASIGCACPGLAQAVEGDGFGGYVDPVVDEAPWLDPAVETSREFLGVVGLTAEGLGSGTFVREPVALSRGGANIGTPRFTHREITYTATLVASSQAGASYGMAWLASVLRGAPPDCWGSEGCAFAWCPNGAADGDQAQRSLYDVGLLEGPETTGQFHSGMWFRTVEFTLAVGNPHLYTRPYVSFGPDEGSKDVVSVPPGGPVAECPEEPPCATDPDCPPPPLPPLPPQPVDPCWPMKGFQAQRTMFQIPPGGVSSWFDTVPVVRIDTADSPMRRLSIRFYANPTGAPCTRFLDRCLACGEANLAWLPAGTVLTVDGRRQRVVMDCSGGRGLALSQPTPFGPGGGLFQWPVIECASGLCVEVVWERDGADPAATVEVDMAARQEAV